MKMPAFQEYLSAKKVIDDRSINQLVWERLTACLSEPVTSSPFLILEAGAGIGTMLERMLEKNILPDTVEFTAIDSDPENIHTALKNLPEWSKKLDWQSKQIENGYQLIQASKSIRVELIQMDVFEFLKNQRQEKRWDLVVANAFLDLIDVARFLMNLRPTVNLGCLLYFTINYDGLTIFEPEVNRFLDEKITGMFNASMDRNQTGSNFREGSRTGRHLLPRLCESGYEILEAGSSDWIVFARNKGYRPEEMVLLKAILLMVEKENTRSAVVNPREFSSWLKTRQRQIKAGELVYIAHQLDVLACWSGKGV